MEDEIHRTDRLFHNPIINTVFLCLFFFYAEQYKQGKKRKNNKKKDKQKASAITPFQTRRYETTLKKKMAARMN